MRSSWHYKRKRLLNELIDEMGWIELMLCLNEQLPGRNFDLSQDDYKSRRFPRVNDLVDHFLKLMAWEDIRRIDVR